MILRKTISSFLIVLILLLGISSNVLANEERDELYTGEVISIISDEKIEYETSGGAYTFRQQVMKVKLLDGKYQGQLVEVVNDIDDMMAYQLIVSKGDKVIVFLSEYDNQFRIFDMKRDSQILWLVILFMAIMLIIGGWKGFKSILSLLITLIAIVGVFLPRVLKGDNPLVLSIIISIIVTFFTILIISGVNKKSITAIMGISFGVISAGLIALIFGQLTHLTGIASSEAQMLMYIPQVLNEGLQLDFGDLLFASILLGTLGAVMDVCISIASAISEIYDANPALKVRQLFWSGMNIGRDIMGTMSNTLILAYVGSSIHIMLLYLAYELPLKDILNQELVATEIVRALTGTIGLVLSIPLTALTGAILYKKNFFKRAN
ncbi:putative membrane protein [Natranaerovirga pectinivora]|uniref:Putative membrane protein n=1 Tax=Natranaerovirga pectinivora TaxID=682400 RepID=A0A4R3MMD0_9FIRM|nr:YibE/F family protein [Natranaerovirga pectinivora]TCT14100.1 putative membrane protein [Natranaerovirga pectinivora]